MTTDNSTPTAKLHDQVDRTHSYHRPNYQETMDKMAHLRGQFLNLAHEIVDLCPLSRELSLALTHMDYANMMAIASLARFEPDGKSPNVTSHPATPDP